MRHILIDKKNRETFALPWQNDSTCFNFKEPEEWVQSNEIKKLDRLDEIETLVIGCDLEDYSFISEMVNLKQLYIYIAKNMKDVDFLKDLINLSHLYIKGSQISSLDPLVELLRKKKALYDGSSDNFSKRIRMRMGGICIFSEFDLDGICLKETKAFVSEIYINGEPYAGSLYDRMERQRRIREHRKRKAD